MSKNSRLISDKKSHSNEDKSYTAYAVSWTESEAGWGCRGDGWSIHKTEDDVKKYQKEHWDRMKEIYGNSTPHEYSRPDNETGKLIKISKSLFNALSSTGTVRLWENSPQFDTYEYTKK